MKEVIDEILKLNPKPGNSLSDSSKVVQHVVPDFNLLVEDDDIQIISSGEIIEGSVVSTTITC